MSEHPVKVSKFLSLVLRHKPEMIGLKLDAAGWVSVDALLRACARHGHKLTRKELERIVRESDKQRFALSDDGARIRASQGHSVKVELGYEPQTPPAVLYHGTVEMFLSAIKRQGLSKGQRHHVHLSEDATTATRVGARRGRPLVLTIRAGAMVEAGFVFYRSANGVWLTDHVPPAYIVFAARAD